MIRSPPAGVGARRHQVVVVEGDAVGTELGQLVHRLDAGEHRPGRLAEEVAGLPADRPEAEAELVLARGLGCHGSSFPCLAAGCGVGRVRVVLTAGWDAPPILHHRLHGSGRGVGALSVPPRTPTAASPRTACTVTARFATVSTGHLDSRPGAGRPRRAAAQRARGDTEADRRTPTSPCTWWRSASRRPRTPKVTRRLAAVLAIAVSSIAVALAQAPSRAAQQRRTARRRRASSRPRRARTSPPACPAAGGAGVGACGPAVRRPRPGAAAAQQARPSRAIPRRSSRAVRRMSTRLSGSSTQSTGTSWMRSPARSARTSSSVSKNHALSSTSGSSSRATSARIALKPHWASLKPVRSVPRSSRL